MAEPDYDFLNEFKKKLIEYARQFDIDIVYGSNKKCSVKEFEKIVLPEDKEELIKILKEKGLWDEMSMINFMRLNSGIIKGSLNNNEIKKMVDVVKDYRISLSKRRNMESEGEE